MDKEAGVKETCGMDPGFNLDKGDEEYLWMTNTLNRGGFEVLIQTES